MKKEIKITAWMYGLAIISVSKFIELKSKHKIRASKMISYFNKNNEIGEDFLQKGAFIPIHNINLYYYTILHGSSIENEKLEAWNIVREWGTFNLSIGEDCGFWVM